MEEHKLFGKCSAAAPTRESEPAVVVEMAGRNASESSSKRRTMIVDESLRPRERRQSEPELIAR